MKISLILVGKTTNAHLEALIDDYRNRLTHYGPFEMIVIPELKNAKNLSEAQQKTEEGQLILRTIPQNADVILLDEHGKEMRSLELADYIQRKMTAGRDLYFVIGGPYGFSPQVYERANGKLSLSQLTFSHQMIRLLFIEQLYRAHTILNHEKYHHE